MTKDGYAAPYLLYCPCAGAGRMFCRHDCLAIARRPRWRQRDRHGPGRIEPDNAHRGDRRRLLPAHLVTRWGHGCVLASGWRACAPRCCPRRNVRFGNRNRHNPVLLLLVEQERRALLRSGEGGFRLERVSVSDDSLSEPTLLDTGQPLYYSWSPDGLTVATHVGTERLETIDSNGAAESLSIEPGPFQAPRWTDRGVIAVEQGLRDQRLVLVAPGEETTAVATLPGPATFVATDGGDKVAVQSVVAGGNGLNASFQALPNIPANRLVVADLDEQVFTPVTAEPVLAFFWSPGGDRLLALDVVDGPQARWSIWSEAGLEEIVRFDPDPSFMSEMVPFFDQYEQSVSLWAPDGSAFAFPGTIDEDPGIWVYTLDGGLDRISSGTWVSWSP